MDKDRTFSTLQVLCSTWTQDIDKNAKLGFQIPYCHGLDNNAMVKNQKAISNNIEVVAQNQMNKCQEMWNLSMLHSCACS